MVIDEIWYLDDDLNCYEVTLLQDDTTRRYKLVIQTPLKMAVMICDSFDDLNNKFKNFCDGYVEGFYNLHFPLHLPSRNDSKLLIQLSYN